VETLQRSDLLTSLWPL